MRVGVLGAMPEEVSAIIAMLERTTRTHAGGRDYTRGAYAGHEVIATHSRIGKVAAASAAIELIVRFGIEELIFTGLAGGLSAELGVGDVVVADGLIQHDMDASPLFPTTEVPLTGCSRFVATPAIGIRLETAAHKALSASRSALGAALGEGPAGSRRLRVVRGDVATGDQFIAAAESKEGVRRRVRSAVCVEMEGAAVAQVCHEYQAPFGVVRMISDSADESAAAEFSSSLTAIEAGFAAAVVGRYLELL
jgi:adenosylhomocysteine nucleosidase